MGSVFFKLYLHLNHSAYNLISMIHVYCIGAGKYRNDKKIQQSIKQTKSANQNKSTINKFYSFLATEK